MDMIINVSRESICNGDDDQKCRFLEYEGQEMLSSFLRNKVADYLPYTSGLIVWAVYMGSSENQPLDEREMAEKRVAFIHKIENRCSKIEIKGGDKTISSFGVDDLFCAVYR